MDKNFNDFSNNIRSLSIVCPVCGSQAVLNTYTRTDPISGKHILKALVCNSCGLKHVEDYPIEEDPKYVGDKNIIIHVESSEDFSKLIFKSSKAYITIPEIGLEIIPTSNSVDEILTIDGLIEKIITYLEPQCPKTENPERCIEVVNWLNNAWKGLFKFTIKINDPSGRTKIFTIRSKQ